MTRLLVVEDSQLAVGLRMNLELEGLAVAGLRPGARVLLVDGTPGGSGTIPECPQLTLPLSAPTVVDRRVADESGATVAAVAAAVAVDAARCVATPQLSVDREWMTWALAGVTKGRRRARRGSDPG